MYSLAGGRDSPLACVDQTVDLPATIGDRAAGLRFLECIMVVKAGLIVLAASLLVASGAFTASASPNKSPTTAHALADNSINSDISAQTRPRPRVRIYGGTRQLPPNAVRQCRAWYAQEHRVSGTYVVPRMQCWWEY